MFGALLLWTLLIYGWVLRAPFVWEDEINVLSNQHLIQGTPLFDVFTQRHWEGAGQSTLYYRPMVDVSYMLDHALGGMWPAVFHISSAVWHALAAFGLFMFLRTAALPALGCLLGAFLFASHPVHVESVAYLSARNTVLSGAFMLWGMFFWLKWRRTDRWGFLAWTALCQWAALSSKESAIVFPALVLLYELVFSPKSLRERRVQAGLGLSWGLALIYQAVRIKVLGLGLVEGFSAGPGFEPVAPTVFGRLATSLRIVWHGIELFLWPAGLHIDRWTELSGGWLDWRALGALAFVALLLWATAQLRTRRPEAAFGIAWFLLCLLPVINIVPLLPVMAERFFYLPYAGVVFLLVPFTRKFLDRFGKGVGLALLGVWIGALSLATAFQTRHWRSLEAVAKRTLRYNPGSYSMHANLGVAFFRKGDIERAGPAFEASLRVKPDYAVALNNLGAIRARQGDPNGALRLYDAAIRSDSRYLLARRNRAQLLAGAGHLSAAEGELRTILRLFPRDPVAWKWLKMLEAETSRPISAGSGARR